MLFAPRPRSLGKDAFLKLADKEEVTGLFKGEIHTFKRHWTNQRSVECIGEGCSVCSVDKENYPAFRFRINFVTTKDGAWIAKIFEGGGELYDILVTLDKKFDLGKTVVDITRNGVKQNTKYNVIPRMDIPVTKEMREKIEAVGTLPLSAEAPEPGA